MGWMSSSKQLSRKCKSPATLKIMVNKNFSVIWMHFSRMNDDLVGTLKRWPANIVSFQQNLASIRDAHFKEATDHLNSYYTFPWLQYRSFSHAWLTTSNTFFINHESGKLNSISSRNSPVNAAKFRVWVINQQAKSWKALGTRLFLRIKGEGTDRLQVNLLFTRKGFVI